MSQLLAQLAQLKPSLHHVLPRIPACSPVSGDSHAATYRFLVSCSVSKRQMWFKLTAGVLEPDMAVMEQPRQGAGTPGECRWDVGEDAQAPQGHLDESPLHPVKIPLHLPLLLPPPAACGGVTGVPSPPSPCFELPKKPEIVLKTSALRLPSTLAAADPDLASAPGCCLPACHSGREVTDPRQGWECQHLGITSSGEEGTMTNARQVSETAAVAAGRGAETQRKHMKV